MYLRRTLPALRMIGDTLSPYGLTDNLKQRLWADRRNRHLLNGRVPPRDVWAPRQMTEIFIPIDTRITGTVDRAINPNGLRPSEIGSTAPPLCTHGASCCFKRTLLRGDDIAWLQTVKREFDPSPRPNHLIEFVDTGGRNVPFTDPAPADRVVFEDVPCGLVSAGQQGMIWTATLSVAVRHRVRRRTEKIVLLAGRTWGFEIVGNNVRVLPHSDASAADMRHQISILRHGKNQFGDDTGGHLNYVLPASPSAVVDLR